MNQQRIAIVQTAFIGDVVLATPLAEAVKRALPEAEVTFVVIPATANLVEHHPHVDRVLVFDKRGSERGIAGLRSLVRKLKGLDIALIPHRSFRSAVAVFWAGVPIRVGFDNSAGAFLFTHTVPYQRLHEVERNLSLLSPLGVRTERLAPRIYPDEEDRRVVSSFLQEQPRSPVVALAPGSIWPTKRWPLQYYRDLTRLLVHRLGTTPVLVGSSEDRALCDEIAAGVDGQALNAAGRLTLRQSAELLRRCHVVVTNDSAPAHLSSAMGTPVVALFGPTIPEFGFAPYGEGHRIFERALPCRPCGWHGGKHCPTGTFECLRSISPAEVLAAVEEILQRYTTDYTRKKQLSYESMEPTATAMG
jgi:heptosyltransferase-2